MNGNCITEVSVNSEEAHRLHNGLLLHTVDGSKVFYRYLEILDRYKESFEGYKENDNKLPNSLRNMALEFAKCCLVNDIYSIQRYTHLLLEASNINEGIIADLATDKVLDEYFSKYNNINEIK
jgi:hypothetical protein